MSKQDKLNNLENQWKDCLAQLAIALITARDASKNAEQLENQAKQLKAEYEKVQAEPEAVTPEVVE